MVCRHSKESGITLGKPRWLPEPFPPPTPVKCDFLVPEGTPLSLVEPGNRTKARPPVVHSAAYRMEGHPPGAQPRLPLSSQSQKSKIFIILQTLLKRDLVEKIYKAF